MKTDKIMFERASFYIFRRGQLKTLTPSCPQDIGILMVQKIVALMDSRANRT